MISMRPVYVFNPVSRVRYCSPVAILPEMPGFPLDPWFPGHYMLTMIMMTIDMNSYMCVKMMVICCVTGMIIIVNL